MPDKDPFREAIQAAATAAGEGEGVGLADFFAYMPMHNYIFAPCRALWPGSSVDARVPRVPLYDADGKPVLSEKTGKPIKIAASAWLDRYRPVEQMTWAPGEEMLIRDRLIAEGGWFPRRGVTCFNLYRPPLIGPGEPDEAERWLNHVHAVYPDDAEHIIRWLAHRVQRAAEKLNHALVLGGEQGIGKDTALEPVKRAVGAWNWQEESPRTILDSRFNAYLKSVILRISEARDLGESDRFAFYDHMKAIIAAPPDVLRINEKHVREYYSVNVVGVIVTTNHKSDGIYLPEDDRRHFVAWSPRKRSDFSEPECRSGPRRRDQRDARLFKVGWISYEPSGPSPLGQRRVAVASVRIAGGGWRRSWPLQLTCCRSRAAARRCRRWPWISIRPSITALIWDSLYPARALAQRAMLRAADAAFAAAAGRQALYAAAVEVLEGWPAFT